MILYFYTFFHIKWSYPYISVLFSFPTFFLLLRCDILALDSRVNASLFALLSIAHRIQYKLAVYISWWATLKYCREKHIKLDWELIYYYFNLLSVIYITAAILLPFLLSINYMTKKLNFRVCKKLFRKFYFQDNYSCDNCILKRTHFAN